jgi:hypothetical protein
MKSVKPEINMNEREIEGHTKQMAQYVIFKYTNSPGREQYSLAWVFINEFVYPC